MEAVVAHSGFDGLKFAIRTGIPPSYGKSWPPLALPINLQTGPTSAVELQSHGVGSQRLP